MSFSLYGYTARSIRIFIIIGLSCYREACGSLWKLVEAKEPREPRELAERQEDVERGGGCPVPLVGGGGMSEGTDQDQFSPLPISILLWIVKLPGDEFTELVKATT